MMTILLRLLNLHETVDRQIMPDFHESDDCINKCLVLVSLDQILRI